jgi:hypothetical protein
LGRIFTLVHANELSASGILAGLKAGNVYISTGPEMGFSVENSKGRIALMGEKIQSGGHPIKLTISIKSGIPLRITIIKNGFFLHSTTFKPGKDSRGVVKFVDEKPARCYYRVEFHKAVDNFTYPEIEWRDHTIIQALGNPIWVE